MKQVIQLSKFVSVILLLSLLSCSKGEKDRLLTGSLPGLGGRVSGTIVVGSSRDASQGAVSAHASITPGLIGHMNVERIEITEDGTVWIPVAGKLHVDASENSTGPTYVEFLENTTVPPGEYHGVKIVFSDDPVAVIEQGPAFDWESDDVDMSGFTGGITQLHIYTSGGLLNTVDWGEHRAVALTTQNGGLTAFHVKANQKIYLLMKMSLGGRNGKWSAYITVWTTRFPPS